MNVVFHPAADNDLEASTYYYEELCEGLGERFLMAVKTTVEHLQLFPLIGHEDNAGYRVFPVNGFPLSVYYEPYSDHIYIIALAHQSRKQNFWKDRV